MIAQPALPMPAPAPFSDLPAGGFGAIMADFPWLFRNFSEAGEGRNPNQHYTCMTIADGRKLPVADLAAPDCALFMWAIDPMLPQAIDMMDAWGFSFKTVAFYWAKTNRDAMGRPLDDRSFFTGLGYWTRANVEQCLLGVRGRPPRLAKDVRRLIVSPRREHSRKPDDFLETMERLYAGPRLELFSRTDRPGWTAWGDEAGKYSGRDSGPAVPVEEAS